MLRVNVSVLRVIGNYGLIVNAVFGQFFDLRLSLFIGLALSLISIPYYAKNKLWDTVIFIAFMMVLNLASALSGVPGCSPKP